MSWFLHDNSVFRSCGKKYKYMALATKHISVCLLANDEHKEAQRRANIPTYWEKKLVRMMQVQCANPRR